jgi:hypothetical protein
MQHAIRCAIRLAAASILLTLGTARADTVITAFDNFNLDGLFPSWSMATITSTPGGYSVMASGFGSGYKALNPNLDATGETNIELTVTLAGTGGPTTPVSGPIVSLVDADGTFYNYAWYGQPQGTHVLKASLSAPTFITAAGSIPGLDLSKLAFFHLQDDPGAYSGQYTISFELLRLTGAPLPNVIVQSYDLTTQQFTLTWTSLPGRSYTILYTTDLSTTFSPLMTDIASGGNTTTTVVTMPGGDSGFLRVQQQ